MSEWNPVYILAGLAVVGALLGIGKWIGAVNTDRESFKEFMNEIRADIKKIFQRLPPSPVTGNSPLRLTDFGKEIADKFGAFEWARELAPELVDGVRGKEPFEVDEFSRKYVNDNWTTRWRRKVMECSYEMGTGMNNVLTVMSVVLREELLRLMDTAP